MWMRSWGANDEMAILTNIRGRFPGFWMSRWVVDAGEISSGGKKRRKKKCIHLNKACISRDRKSSFFFVVSTSALLLAPSRTYKKIFSFFFPVVYLSPLPERGSFRLFLCFREDAGHAGNFLLLRAYFAGQNCWLAISCLSCFLLLGAFHSSLVPSVCCSSLPVRRGRYKRWTSPALFFAPLVDISRYIFLDSYPIFSAKFFVPFYSDICFAVTPGPAFNSHLSTSDPTLYFSRKS